MSKKTKRPQKPPNNQQPEETFTLKDVLRDKGLRIFCTILVTGMIAGYAFGRAISPVYDDPTASPMAIRQYVAETVRKQVLVAPPEWPSYEKTYYPDGRLKTLTPVVSKLTFTCGITNYTFNGKTVEPSPSPVRDDFWRPRRGMSILDSMTLFLGGIEGYQLRTTAPKYLKYIETAGTRSRVIKRIVGGIVSFASGFGVGVYFGYRNDPQCGDDLFNKFLLDKVFWKGVQSEANSMNTFHITYDKTGNPILNRRKGGGRFYGSYELKKSLERSSEQRLSAKEWLYSER